MSKSSAAIPVAARISGVAERLDAAQEAAEAMLSLPLNRILESRRQQGPRPILPAELGLIEPISTVLSGRPELGIGWPVRRLPSPVSEELVQGLNPGGSGTEPLHHGVGIFLANPSVFYHLLRLACGNYR